MLVKIMIVASDFYENKGFIDKLQATLKRDLSGYIKTALIGAYRVNHAVSMVHHADIIIGSGTCKEHAEYETDDVVEYDASELATVYSKQFIALAAADSRPEIVTAAVEEFVRIKSEQ